MYNGSGYVGGTRIDSTTVSSQDFWLQCSDGREKHIHVPKHHIPLRGGQTITVFFAKNADKGKEVPISLYVHNTGDEFKIMESLPAINALDLNKSRGHTFFICLALLIGCAYFDVYGHGIEAGFKFAVTYGVFRIILRSIRNVMLSKKLEGIRDKMHVAVKNNMPVRPAAPNGDPESVTGASAGFLR
jgi:hypothetical protein